MWPPNQLISRHTSGSPSGRIGSAYGGMNEPRVAAAHLVMIHVGLRQPVAIHQLADVLRFRQVQREAVAVVVVAGVLLVQPWRIRRLVRRADILHVPVGDHLRAVGIDRRQHDADDVVEDCASPLRRCATGSRRRTPPPSGPPPLRSSAARSSGSSRPCRRTISFRASASGQAARIGEPRVQLPKLFQLREVGGRRDEERDVRPPLARLAELDELDAVGAPWRATGSTRAACPSWQACDRRPSGSRRISQGLAARQAPVRERHRSRRPRAAQGEPQEHD